MFICQKCELMPSCMYPAERDRVFILLHSKVIPLSELSCKSSRITNNKVTLAKPSIAFRRNTEASGSKNRERSLSVIGRRVDFTQTMRVDFNSTIEVCIGTTRIAKKRKQRKKALNKFTKKKCIKLTETVFALCIEFVDRL